MRKIKKGFLFLFLTCSILFGALFLVGKFGGKQVTGQIVSLVNQQLTAKVLVSNVSFTLIERFPKASVKLHDVLIADAQTGDTMMSAPAVFLDFDVWDLFTGERKIDKVSAKGLTLNIQEYPSGKINIAIWESAVQPTSAEYSLPIFDLEAKHIVYQSAAGLFVESFDNKIVVEPNATKTGRYKLSSKSLWIKDSQNVWMRKITIKSSGKYAFDEHNATMIFYMDKTQIPNAYFTGNLQLGRKNSFEIAGNISNPTVTLQCLSPILPDIVKEGEIQGALTVKGGIDFSNSTQGKLAFTWEKGSFFAPKFGRTQIEKSNFELYSTNDVWIMKPGKLNLKNSWGEANVYAGELFFGQNFSGYIKTSGNCVLKTFTEQTSLKNISGIADFDLHIEVLSTTDITQNFLNNVSPKGRIVLKNVQLNTEEELIQVEGELKVRPDKIVSENINCRINQNQLNVKGEIINWDAYPKSEVYLSIKGEKISFEEFVASNFHTNLTIYPRHKAIVNAEAFVWNGKQNLAGNILKKGDIWQFNGTLNSTNVELSRVTSFFSKQLHPYIVSENISGYFSSTSELSIPFSSKIQPDLQNLHAQIKYQVSEATLSQLPLLEDVRNHLKKNLVANTLINKNKLISRLEHIEWNTWNGLFVINEGTVTMQETELISDQFRMNITGEHDFSGEMDYRMNFSLSELFRRNKDSEYGYITDTGGELKLFLRMAGKSPNVNFSFDHEGAKIARKNRLKEEKNSLKDIFSQDKEPNTLGSPRFKVEEETPKKDTVIQKKNGRLKRLFNKVLESGDAVEEKNSKEFGIEEDTP